MMTKRQRQQRPKTRVVWWEEPTYNHGHSEPMPTEQAEHVKRALKYDRGRGFHAIKMEE